jgi:peptidoglycan-N-acetylglucosamine deacetylase
MMDIGPGVELAGAAAVCAAAAGVGAWGAVAPSSQLFGPTLRRTGSSGTIALTFDDGPNPSVTPELLELLDRHGAKATFFLIGRFAREESSLTREIAQRGHCVGNHTETHPSLVFLSSRRIQDELSRCDDAIGNAIGATPRWMRPPYGFRSPYLNGIARQRSYKGVVMWSRMARDWKLQPAESVVSRLRGTKDGDIVLLHDGDHRTLRGDRGHTVKALEHWLPRWRDAGLKFVTLDDFGQDEVPDQRKAPAC